ncbi:MAG: type I pantothenate kinase [Oscillochloris sp.]|nr:type I pantothenate kinase [Oscillochloris sp.]
MVRATQWLAVPIDEEELDTFVSLNDTVSLEDVADIYLPMKRLLQLYYAAQQNLYHVTNIFLSNPAAKVPYVIGIAGSVAVGKSSTARILQALLARGPDRPRVDLVTTDGFLYPNAVLHERGIMHRKGFPESYDRRRLLQFMTDVKSGRPVLDVPVYSHLVYDIVPDEVQMIDRPDILIVEGLNVLQRGGSVSRHPHIFVSDFFDFSIYVDADEKLLQQWYVERFLRLYETAFRDPSSYFRRYADLSVDEAIATARRIWSNINGVNLKENIEPTRERADLILEKGERHRLEQIYLRKL